ncbi:MAG: ABC transporter substrate-binding protein, partial [Deltaproteobacteria bacterium]|nr:ABC transporter substrate-binding protein [Deltaproteobacteria bacterium]
MISDAIQVGFMVAPMAIALRSQGVPVKIVYLGHKYGSAMVVRKDGPVRTVADLRGKVIGIPSRFSDERLLTHKALKQHNIPESEVKLVEMPPPDVASALEAGALDAFVMGEPYPSQSEMQGIGRVLFFAREYWPDYMSCVVVMRQDIIDERPDVAQVLVDGLARSGVWLDDDIKHREQASEFVGREYFHKSPALLKWSLTKPFERIEYRKLSPRKVDFELVRDLMFDLKLIDRKIDFNEFVETKFAEAAEHETAWK